jgi:hypothetical protein
MAIPSPLEFGSVEEYQSAIFVLAQRQPDSICDFAQYAFRKIDVPFPQAYVYAALRDYHVKQSANTIRNFEDALNILKNIKGEKSIFDSRDRLALPDETLLFQTGNDRDKALLLYTLLHLSTISDPEMAIGFSENDSYVYYNREWIELNTLSKSSIEPKGLRIIFNKQW